MSNKLIQMKIWQRRKLCKALSIEIFHAKQPIKSVQRKSAKEKYQEKPIEKKIHNHHHRNDHNTIKKEMNEKKQKTHFVGRR